MQSAPQVVVTGIGVISPYGPSRAAMWDAILAGRSAVAPLPELAKLHADTGFGARIEGFDAKNYVTPRKSIKVMSPEAQWGFAAAKLALADAGIEPGKVDVDRVGVVYGTDLVYSDPRDLAEGFRNCMVDGRLAFSRWGEHALGAMYPLWLLKYLPNMPACHIGISNDARGPNNTISLGEVSSLVAMNEATRLIERGAADVVITGGTSDGLNTWSWTSRQTRHSRRHWDPAGACRPFDADRDGMACGQGAAALIFESDRHATARGARPMAKVLSTANAFNPKQAQGWPQEGDGVARVIRQALAGAGLSAEQLGFITAHGYGTVAHDRSEARGILASAPGTPVTALKGYLSCLHAAGGAMEAVVAISALEHGRAPVALNSERPDFQCPLNIVRGEPARLRSPIAMVLAQGTMGQAAAVIFALPDA